MAIECTASNLATLSKCLNGLTPVQMASIQTYLLCQLSGGGSGIGGVTSGVGPPVAAPSGSTGIYFDTATGVQYNYYSGAWH